MRLTSIKPRRAGRVQVTLEDGTKLILAAEIVMRSGLQVGTILDSGRVAALEAEDLAWRTQEAALQLLSRRPRSTRELRRQLSLKGFPDHLVEESLQRLREGGLVDDVTFARELARERIRNRPCAQRLLLNRLRGKGVDPELARRAVREAMEVEGVSEVDLARQAARRFLPRTGEDPRRARDRLGAFLSRRGFATGTILQVIDNPPD